MGQTEQKHSKQSRFETRNNITNKQKEAFVSTLGKNGEFMINLMKKKMLIILPNYVKPTVVYTGKNLALTILQRSTEL